MNARLVIYSVVVFFLGLSWIASCVIYQAAEMGEQLAPLEPRSVEELTLVTIGTGNAYENPARGGPATAVTWESHVILVDAGRAVAEGLRAAGIPVTQPDTVLLTSLLPENLQGLDDLIYTGWIGGRETPLRVLGPTGTSEAVASLVAGYARGAAALEQGLALAPTGLQVEAQDVGDGFQEEQRGLRLQAAVQPGGPLPALAWRVEYDRRRAVLAGSTFDAKALVEFARDTHLLLHEAVVVPPPEEAEELGLLVSPEQLRRERAFRTQLQDVGALARDAGVQTLVLVRMRPPPLYAFQATSVVAQDFEGNILIPEDGDEIKP
ncbi:MAG: hypothetical protein MJE66_21040 [Proteobacteria bacterium]|nr:hypothetical protein [Pseudomonadota bacterium]